MQRRRGYRRRRSGNQQSMDGCLLLIGLFIGLWLIGFLIGLWLIYDLISSLGEALHATGQAIA